MVVTNYYLAMLLLYYFVILKAVNFIEPVKLCERGPLL